MNTSITVSGYARTEISPGTEFRPVFLQFKSGDYSADCNIFMTYPEALTLASQLRVACGAEEAKLEVET
jgi:hypothetical protein